MLAIIKTGGKQLKVFVGTEIFVEKLELEANETVTFDEVLMMDTKFGNPYLKNASVKGVILKNDRAKKIVVFKYKPKKDSHKKYGHRQPYSKVFIESFILDGKVIAEQKNTSVNAEKALNEPEIKAITKSEATEVKTITKKIETVETKVEKSNTTKVALEKKETLKKPVDNIKKAIPKSGSVKK